jgi:hypothetical protein
MGDRSGGAKKWGGQVRSPGGPPGEVRRLPCRDALLKAGRAPWSMPCCMPRRAAVVVIAKSLGGTVPSGVDRSDVNVIYFRRRTFEILGPHIT